VRAVGSIAFWLLTGVCCLAQQEDKKLLERVLAKPDMSLMNPMNEKKFEGAGYLLKKNTDGAPSFMFDQKLSLGKYRNLRSFLGLRNPWFGKRVYESSQASLWSKTLVVNADTMVPVNSAKIEKFYQADKKAAKREEPVKTSAYLGGGSAQGRLDQISDKIDKKMTIEEVRQLLNKNR
jgi:hypothetical protein